MNKKRGFTLIELLIVIAIVGIVGMAVYNAMTGKLDFTVTECQ